MKTHIVYHGNCADGFAAACFLYHCFTTSRFAENITLQAISPDHSALPDGLRDSGCDEVYYLDCTPSAEVIHQLMGCPQGPNDLVIPQVAMLSIFDHHSDKAKIHEGLVFSPDTPIRSFFDPSKSGARLVWEHHFPMPIPPALALLDWYDLGGPWQHPEDERSERAQSLQAGLMRTMPRTAEAWLPVLIDLTGGILMEECISRGRMLRAAAKEIIAAACRSPIWLDIAGYRVPAVTGLAMEHANDAATMLLEMYPNTAPFSVVFYVQAAGPIKYSLRTRKGDIDVAAIAAQMGTRGGGHPKAAGYTSIAPLPLAV